MRKLAKPISAVALILAIVICFSGCGIIEFTRSIIQKNNNVDVTNVGNTQNTGDVIVPGNQDVTNSAVIVTPSTNATNGTSTPPATQNSSSTKPQTKPSESTTQSSGQNVTEPVTNAPVVDDNITEEDLKEMPIKDVQDLLFATEDPNTAGKILEFAGFEYDEKQGIYYSQMNPLQRKFGFNLVYDMAAPMVGMVYDTKRIEFVYDNREWMIQIWKGQYGMTAGAEVGLYKRDPERNFQYDCADDEDPIEMQFDFYNQDEFVFSRGPEKHWWLTGFKILNVGVPILIDLDITLKFSNKIMAQAFAQSLKKTASTSLLDPITYKVTGSTVNIKW